MKEDSLIILAYNLGRVLSIHSQFTQYWHCIGDPWQSLELHDLVYFGMSIVRIKQIEIVCQNSDPPLNWHKRKVANQITSLLLFPLYFWHKTNEKYVRNQSKKILESTNWHKETFLIKSGFYKNSIIFYMSFINYFHHSESKQDR